MSDCKHGGKDVPSATDAVRALVERYEKRIVELAQKVEDLEGMLGNLPPEGKCAMLIVQNNDGEYIWQSEPFDFASYTVVDLDADTFTGKALCDPFGKADHADELTMADTLREAAAMLDEQGDSLGVIGLQRKRIAELEKLVREMFDVAAVGEFDVGEEACFARRLEELGIEVG